jgi:hypothetical protein
MPPIDISIIHDTLAVIANEVKQSKGFGILDCRVDFASSQ